MTLLLWDLPKACDQSTEEKEAISLDKRRQEGKEAIGGHADEEALSAAHLVWHAAPKERSDHHPKVNNAACKYRVCKQSVRVYFWVIGILTVVISILKVVFNTHSAKKNSSGCNSKFLGGPKFNTLNLVSSIKVIHRINVLNWILNTSTFPSLSF